MDTEGRGLRLAEDRKVTSGVTVRDVYGRSFDWFR